MENEVLERPDVERALRELEGWRQEDGALAKTFEFGSFREAISFMVRVAFEAESLNHHPDWSNVYNRVVIHLRTHAAGRQVTRKDVELARAIERINWVR